MRVLLVGPSPAMLGGISSLAVHLVELLSREPSLRVGFLPIDPLPLRPLRWMQRIRYVRTLATCVQYLLSLLARLGRFDVVHVYSASYNSFLIASAPAILVARMFRRPVVLNYHSGNAEDHLREWAWIALPILRLADTIVVSSRYLARVFAGYGLHARVLPSPIALERFSFRERAPLRPVFLTSRLLEPIYNVECVIRAFAVIQRRHPDASLTVAGDGWQRGALERLAEKLALRRTRFIGRVPLQEVPRLYDEACIYLSATDVDNVPSSLLEAMAAGLPVVTSDAGGIPDLVEHGRTALMVGRGDHEALAAEALRLLSDPELARSIRLDARQTCRQFRWEAVRDGWLQLYRELAVGRSSHGCATRLVPPTSPIA